LIERGRGRGTKFVTTSTTRNRYNARKLSGPRSTEICEPLPLSLSLLWVVDTTDKKEEQSEDE